MSGQASRAGSSRPRASPRRTQQLEMTLMSAGHASEVAGGLDARVGRHS